MLPTSTNSAFGPTEPPTIGGLLYPGKRTLLSGETESLKTWLALILAKAEIQVEQPVAWVDLDDMGAGAILQRLRALQISDEQIHDHFLYYQPDQRLYDTRDQKRTEILNDVLSQLTTSGTRLMIIDAFNPVLNLHGLDPNSTPDIETFWREIADPIAKTGTAPVLLDHVAKNADTRGKYAYGSERKASGATVHIGTHTLNALAIGTTGRTLLTTHKDRPGYLPRPTIGVLELASDGTWITYKLDSDKSHETGSFRPTVLMERISKTLESHKQPVSKSWIEDKTNISGNTAAKRTALTILVSEGYISQETGPRNSHIYTLSNQYREAEDPIFATTADPDPTSTMTSTNPDHFAGQFGVSTTSTATLPYGGVEVVAPLTSTMNGSEPPVELPPIEAYTGTEPEEEDA